MITAALALQACLAGFLIYPAIVGFYAWFRTRPDWLWITMAAWSLVSAALLVVNAAFLWPETPVTSLGTLVTVRHMLVNLSVLLVLAVMFQLSGRVPWLLTGIVVTIIVARGVLWVTTDLVWAHEFVDGAAVYGPLRGPASLLITVLVVACAVYSVTRRPWPSEFARRALLYAMFPGVLLSLLALVPGVFGEYMVAVVLVPSLLSVQLMYFGEFRREQKRIAVMARRETRLASFGTDVLAEPTQVPELAAVALVTEMLHATCRFVSASGEIIADGGDRISGGHLEPEEPAGPERQWSIEVPVDVAGRQSGLIQVASPDPSDDDQAFVAAVGAVLSAALNRSRAEALLREEALHDTLTGLPNWALLQDRLRRLLNQAGALPIGILCCDIQGLKDINDEFGHDAGDAVLKAVATRLDGLTSAQGTAARIGADEFVLVEPTLDPAAADALARQIAAVGNPPIEVGGGEVLARIRVGFTVAEDPGTDLDRAVRDAEMAMMLAKNEDTAQVAYTERVRSHLVGRRRMIRELESAIANQDIHVAYQPVVHLATMTVSGVEALARWQNLRGEQIPPMVFIPLAEEIGLIGDLGALVFEQAVGQLAAWSAEHPSLARLRVALNLSPAQVTDPELVPALRSLLSRHGLEPRRVTLEVTESGLERATDAIAGHLQALRELGVGLSLDDFGTGYSTLTRLMAFPVTELKIDRQFTSQTGRSARVIVPAIVGLAHASGLSVVAEGIETEAQRRLIVADGCDYGQGYLFARPLAGHLIPDFVRNGDLLRSDRRV